MPGGVHVSGRRSRSPRSASRARRSFEAGRPADPARDQDLSAGRRVRRASASCVMLCSRRPCAMLPVGRPGAARRVVELGGRQAVVPLVVLRPPAASAFPVESSSSVCSKRAVPIEPGRRPSRIQNRRIDDRRVRPGDAHRAGRGARRGHRPPPGRARVAVDRAAGDRQRAVGPGAVGADDVRGRDVQPGRAARRRASRASRRRAAARRPRFRARRCSRPRPSPAAPAG